MQRVKMQNPGPASLVLINPKRGKSMAARKRASTSRRRPARRRAAVNPKWRRPVARVRGRRTTSHLRAPARRRGRRRPNPLLSVKRRRSVSRRRSRNPISGALGQAIPLVGASFVITFAAPIVTGFVGRFLPLGQFTQPVVLAGTGYGLGWLSGKLGFGKYRGPLEIMGVTLGLTALVAPYLRGLFAPSAPAQNGMNGPYRNRYGHGLNGIAAVSAVPPMMLGAPPVPAQQGMNGIAANSVPGRF